MKKYIDADIVNLKLKQICDNRNTSYGIQFGGRAKDFAQLTDDIPAADVKEVWHGEWEIEKYKNHLNVVCSNCNKEFYVYKQGQYRIDRSNYCPNCGAKMGKGQEC